MNTTPTTPVPSIEDPEAATRHRTGRVAATVTALVLAVGGSALAPALAEPGAAPADGAAVSSSECSAGWHAASGMAHHGKPMTSPAAQKASCAAAAAPATHTYDDGATVTWPSRWEYGKPLTLQGTGFLTQDKTAGSTVALKLNSGGINHLTPVEGQKNASIWVVAQADAQGNFTVQAPFPITENSDLDTALEPGEAVDLTLLTGSLKTGDVVRGGSIGETTVGPRAATTDPSATPEPTTSATATPSQSAQPTPGASDSAEPTVEETEIVVTEPEATEDAATDQSVAEQDTVTENQICEDLGVTDLSTDDPQYTKARDRDGDGVACESGNGNGMSGTDDGAASGGDGSGTGAAISSSGDLASTGASKNTGLLVSGGVFVLTAGVALVILARRRATR